MLTFAIISWVVTLCVGIGWSVERWYRNWSAKRTVAIDLEAASPGYRESGKANVCTLTDNDTGEERKYFLDDIRDIAVPRDQRIMAAQLDKKIKWLADLRWGAGEWEIVSSRSNR